MINGLAWNHGQRGRPHPPVAGFLCSAPVAGQPRALAPVSEIMLAGGGYASPPGTGCQPSHSIRLSTKPPGTYGGRLT
jgi:hypothetical protein